MTVEEFFDDFLTSEVNLNKICEGECAGSDPNCDICLVTSTYKDLVDSLKNELKILPTEDEENKPSYFLTGSYRRHTMIRPPKDVDLFLVLDSGEYQDEELDQLITPTALIQKLKSTLIKIFEENDDIEVKEQRHSVTVIYSETFSIDVIPAFETDDQEAYLIPDIEDGNDGTYIVSNPKVHFEYINQINEDTAVNSKKRFKKVARLIKFVKRQRLNEKPTKVRSFHLELLAAKILGDSKINSYAEGLNKFFSVASDYFDDPVLEDPANEENMVDDYLEEMSSDVKQLIKDELDSLYRISGKAVQLEEDSNDRAAITEWKKIFSVDDRGTKKNEPVTRSTYVGSSPSKPWCNV
ncbi:MAG: nucleotidyltransferase [Candidatus Shapirobacteria bacterium]